MAQPTLRALVRDMLRQNNSDLETAFVQLEPFLGNRDVDAMLDMLRQQAQQNKHAIGLFNSKDTDGAVEAMPKRSVVQHVCQQVDELLDHYEENLDDDVDGFEPPKSDDADDSPKESEEVNDDATDGSDNSNPEPEEPEPAPVTKRLDKPASRPTTARQLRQQPPAPVDNDLKQEFAALAAKQSLEGLTYEEHLRFRELRKQLKKATKNTDKPSLGERWKKFLAEHSLAEDDATDSKGR